MSTDDVELFGSTVASVGAGYRNLRLLARSTASVDVNILSTSERKKTSSRGGGSANLVSSGAARLTVAHKHAGKKIQIGSFSGYSQAAALSLGFLSRRSVAPPAGRMDRQKEERSSEFAKGRVGAWEQPCVLESGSGSRLASLWL